MENQHQKIIGYRDLTQAEIDMMNRIKEQERVLAGLWLEVRKTLADAMMERPKPSGDAGHSAGNTAMLDYSEMHRQLATARTHFEEGFMHLTRAVAKPESPWAPGALRPASTT